MAVDCSRVNTVGAAGVVGDIGGSALDVCVVSFLLDRSSAFDCALPLSVESANCLFAADCASVMLLFKGNEDISRGVDEVGRSDWV